MKPTDVLHPLFDPTSKYGSFRSSFSPQDKVHGYFQWLARCRRTSKALPAEQAASRTQPLVLLAEAPGRALAAKVSVEMTPSSSSAGTLQLRLQLSDPSALMECLPAAFRAFLLEPEVMERLAQAVQVVGQSRETVLARVFAPETVAGNFEVARVLSAVPELDGEINLKGSGTTAHVSLPVTSPVVEQLPAEVVVAVVVGNRVGPHPPVQEPPQPAGQWLSHRIEAIQPPLALPPQVCRSGGHRLKLRTRPHRRAALQVALREAGTKAPGASPQGGEVGVRITLLDGQSPVELPEALAIHYYGETQLNKVRLWLHLTADQQGAVWPEVEVLPCPTKAAMLLAVTFPGGEARTFTVPVEPGGGLRKSAPVRGKPLPEAALCPGAGEEAGGLSEVDVTVEFVAAPAPPGEQGE